MKFTIIIPSLNEEHGIVNCLMPLQSLRDTCEIIVVDGGSADRTVALAEPWCDLLLTSAPGRAVQMNCGARHACGEILLFLHADTFLPEHALDMIVQAVKVNKCWGRFDIRLSGSHFLLTFVAGLMNWRSRLTSIATGDQCIFITKQLFDEAGQYPEIPLMEDIALCNKLKRIVSPVCLSAKVVSSGRRWEQYGVVKTIMLMWILRLRYYFGTDPMRLAAAYKNGRLWKI